jgi:hypothetical protein
MLRRVHRPEVKEILRRALRLHSTKSHQQPDLGLKATEYVLSYQACPTAADDSGDIQLAK